MEQWGLLHLLSTLFPTQAEFLLPAEQALGTSMPRWLFVLVWVVLVWVAIDSIGIGAIGIPHTSGVLLLDQALYRWLQLELVIGSH